MISRRKLLYILGASGIAAVAGKSLLKSSHQHPFDIAYDTRGLMELISSEEEIPRIPNLTAELMNILGAAPQRFPSELRSCAGITSENGLYSLNYPVQSYKVAINSNGGRAMRTEIVPHKPVILSADRIIDEQNRKFVYLELADARQTGNVSAVRYSNAPWTRVSDLSSGEQEGIRQRYEEGIRTLIHESRNRERIV